MGGGAHVTNLTSLRMRAMRRMRRILTMRMTRASLDTSVSASPLLLQSCGMERQAVRWDSDSEGLRGAESIKGPGGGPMSKPCGVEREISRRAAEGGKRSFEGGTSTGPLTLQIVKLELERR